MNAEPDQILSALPLEQRLALAYADARSRELLAGMFALDARLADAVRAAREPVLGQMRLAWWRDQLRLPIGSRSGGEPVLELLGAWGADTESLAALVDGWEVLLGEAPLTDTAIEDFAEGRAATCAALAMRLREYDCAPEAERAGRNWALADFAARSSHADERQRAIMLAQRQDWRRPLLPRSLRPLLVMHGLARRGRNGGGLLAGPGALLVALRLGIFGI